MAKLGEVNTLVLLESLKRQQEAKLSLVEARREEALAEIDLDELIGPARERLGERVRTDEGAGSVKGGAAE